MTDVLPEEGIEPTEVSFESLLSTSPLLSRFQELGFSTPTDIQKEALPKALAGKDIIIQAKTGSGKTLAFVLPLLEKLAKLSAGPGETCALCIAPTRELAVQIQEVILQLDPTLSPVLVIGGVEEKKQRTALEANARIVVGTPGRLLDLLQRKILQLKQCRYFVLDEADEMLSMGFIEDVRAILSRLPKQRQGLFVSATITPRVEMLANSFLTKPEYIAVISNADDAPPIEHMFCEVAGDLLAKPHALCDIIETQRPRSAIIFCNTKSDTQLVEVLLRRRGFDARRMNSDLSQSQRQRVISKIKSEDLQLLVATDIAARGLDIAQLDLVINYSLHDQSETYIHRTGRTGRAGKKGRAISLIGPRDFGSFHYLTKTLSVEFTKLELPTDEEVADARLAHLYEILRTNEPKSDGRGSLSARKLLKDIGGIETPPEDLVDILARLCEFTIGHFVAEEAKSLDEEFEAANREKADSPSEERQWEDRREGGRDNKRRDRKKDTDRDSRRGPKEGRTSSGDEPAAARELPAAASSTTAPEKYKPEIERVRLYVGQGSAQGLTDAVFLDLAQSLGEVNPGDISRISVREHYCYIDASEAVATQLLSSLNGIDFKGAQLPLEIAVKYESQRRPNNQQRRGGGGGGNSDRGRSNNNRGRGRNSGNRNQNNNRRDHNR